MVTHNPPTDTYGLRGKDPLSDEALKVQADRYQMLNFNCGRTGRQKWLDGAMYVINILKERGMICPQ